MVNATLRGRRLVVVSNRVPVETGGAGGASGGLVSTLGAALDLGDVDALWFGWSGRVAASREVHRRVRGNLAMATIDLSPEEVRDHYDGFCNQTLWPVLHGLTHRARMEPNQQACWRAVNRSFALNLRPLLRDDDVVCVHDYHLIPLGAELRALGWRGPLGYFHHVPVPSREGWHQLPAAGRIAALFSAYDLVGVQTAADVARLAAVLPPGVDRPAIAAHPVSIDPDAVRARAALHPDDSFRDVRRGRRVVFGVDRLDYSKGLPIRFAAFERLLERAPHWRRDAAFVQWAAPSRERVKAYRRERVRVERAASQVNERYPDPRPVELDCAAHPSSSVAAALRDAGICLVTSLADGMNLVAKEFVAAQPPGDPGVLILSDTCGAARELGEALQVPATNLGAIERALDRALSMPRDERIARWRAMQATIEAHTAGDWLAGYVSELDRIDSRRSRGLTAASEAPATTARSHDRMNTLAAGGHARPAAGAAPRRRNASEPGVPR